ncbi:MAG TPA: hypothetical protein VJT73_18985, partial [Polyangiaceae bacterium]|nr:hypothetical protein [Polyangiaceae bacterium]
APPVAAAPPVVAPPQVVALAAGTFDFQTPTPAPAVVAAAAPAVVAAASRLARPGSNSAELEKSDPRHQAARRFARLAVSEIVLYHEADVAAGRVAKDLWTRLSKDIKLCIESYEKRVPKEVRDQHDHLYDEFVRQLAESDPEKLGPHAPGSAR